MHIILLLKNRILLSVVGGGSSSMALLAPGGGAADRLTGGFLQMSEAVLHIRLVHIGSEHQTAEADRADPVKEILKHHNDLQFNCCGGNSQFHRI